MNGNRRPRLPPRLSSRIAPDSRSDRSSVAGEDPPLIFPRLPTKEAASRERSYRPY